MLLNDILDMLDRLKVFVLLLYRLQYFRNQSFLCSVLLLHLVIRLANRLHNLIFLIENHPSVSFLNFHYFTSCPL